MTQGFTAHRNGTSGLSEAELIEASRDGNAAAYAELWSRTRRLVYSIARTRNAGDADDIVAATFTAVWEQLLAGKGPREAFKAYVAQVARNLAAQMYRTSLKTSTNIEIGEIADTNADCGWALTSGNDAVDAADQIIRKAEQQGAIAAFQQLPEAWQQAIWWQDVDGLGRIEVARRLQMSPTAVSSLTCRAREGFRIAYLSEQLPSRETAAHPQIVEQLPKHVRGTLSPKLEQRILRHLDGCVDCSAVDRELRSLNPALVPAVDCGPDTMPLPSVAS